MKESDKITDKREMLIEKAIDLFFKNGYDNTSIRMLAKETNLSVAGIYYFFQDKEDILFTILKQSSEDLIKSVSKRFDQNTDPELFLRETVRNMLRHNVRHNKDMVILNREDTKMSGERQLLIMQAKRKAFDHVKSVFMQFCQLGRMREEDLVLASFTLFAETTWFARWFREDGKYTLDYFADRIVDMFLTGLISPGGQADSE